MTSFKDKFIGGCELLLLFGRGVDRFSGTKDEAVRSLAIPALIYISSFLLGDVYPPDGMEKGYSTIQIVSTLVAQFVLSYIITAILTYEFAKWIKCGDKFWLYLSASNWTSLPVGFICLLLTFLAMHSFTTRGETDNIFSVLQLYTYLVTACIAYSAFRINWQLAGAVAIANMFIDQQTWHFLYAIQHIPMP